MKTFHKFVFETFKSSIKTAFSDVDHKFSCILGARDEGGGVGTQGVLGAGVGAAGEVKTAGQEGLGVPEA